MNTYFSDQSEVALSGAPVYCTCGQEVGSLSFFLVDRFPVWGHFLPKVSGPDCPQCGTDLTDTFKKARHLAKRVELEEE